MDRRRYDDLLAEAQRFRGAVYRSDGAIQSSDLTPDGRYRVAIDESSWHILTLDLSGRVVSCLRYLDESRASDFDDLWIRHCALARCPQFGRRFRAAVEKEMERARSMRIGWVEVGGWAVAEDHRWTLEPLRIVLAACALAELLGGSLGLVTATFRHSSAMILRRIGLHPMMSEGQPLPPYHDPQYRCQMEALQFDSRRPNPKYGDWVAELLGMLAEAPVICRERTATALQSARHEADRAPQSEPLLLPAAI